MPSIPSIHSKNQTETCFQQSVLAKVKSISVDLFQNDFAGKFPVAGFLIRGCSVMQRLPQSCTVDRKAAGEQVEWRQADDA